MRGVASLVVGAVVIAIAAPVTAHGSFVDARPLPGVTVGGTVDEVAFLFPEPVSAVGAQVTVISATGGEIDPAGELESPAPGVVRLPIVALEHPGDYRVEFRVHAVDGFVFEGEFGFVYDPTAEPLDPLPHGRGDGGGRVAVIAMVVVVAGAAAVWVRSRRRGRGRTRPSR